MPRKSTGKLEEGNDKKNEFFSPQCVENRIARIMVLIFPGSQFFHEISSFLFCSCRRRRR
jgi:hypothetical protein